MKRRGEQIHYRLGELLKKVIREEEGTEKSITVEEQKWTGRHKFSPSKGVRYRPTSFGRKEEDVEERSLVGSPKKGSTST